jgi:hypothetical protein
MAWPNPTSVFELHVHLAADHGQGDRDAAGWFELDQAHRHFHRVGADHEHEKLAGVTGD